ncbi:MAG: M48 family metalloprotease [Armatimonadetes bacterium]|nr:M48 family metalloprotease [Armatimonadota bacterium]
MSTTRAVVACLATACLLAACGPSGPPMLVSQDDEIAIGREVAADAEKQYGQPLRHGVQVDRVNAVWSRLRPHTTRNVPYSVNVLYSQEINAFACPGGPLYFFRALVDRMSEDGELAFVVGHEASHVECEHGRESINQALLVNVGASVLLKDQGQLADFGASVAYTLYSQGYSRQHEREADSRGLKLMEAAGYDPQWSLSALRKLGGDELHGPAKWLASHPSTPERIRRLEAQIQADRGH